jgi:hypothetical protein
MSGKKDDYHWKDEDTAPAAARSPIAALLALRKVTSVFCPGDQPMVAGIQVTVLPLEKNVPGSFERFISLPAELRRSIWKETVAFAPRILTYEGKRDDSTTFEINLFSRARIDIATVCSESYQVQLGEASQAKKLEILAVSPKLDMIHFGPEFKIEHLEAFAETISKSQAGKVRHLILESQTENTYSAVGGGQRMIIPKFFKICALLPGLTRIIFVSYDQGRGSSTPVGDLVFTTLDSGQTSEADGRTFKQFAEQQYPVFLARQLLAKGMGNKRPEILFMKPVEVSTLQN